jgi:phage terminase small subunit
VDVREEARLLYERDGLGLKAIAERLDIRPGTVRQWKNREKWSGRERNVTRNVTPEKPDELTDQQEHFCQHYIRTYNAFAAYMASHPGSAPSSGRANAYLMLRRPDIIKRLEQLRDAKLAGMRATPDDVIELYMRIAFADLGDYANWDGESVALEPTSIVDGQLVKKVTQTKDGISIELVDKQKALDFLAQYFLMNPLDRHKVDYDKKRLEIEEWKVNGNPDAALDVAKQSQAIADLINSPAGERRIEDHMPSGGAVDDPIRASHEAPD